jgi:hypothetical protein
MIQDLLKKHVGYVIAINATDPEKLESCGLKTVGTEYFSVVTQKELLIHIPYARLLSIVEDNNGGPVIIKKGLIGSAQSKLVIHIEHMIIYKGATSFGFQVPI